MRSRRDKKNICIIAYTFYEFDYRVRRYAEALVKEGYSVDVIVLQGEKEPKRGILNGVEIYRIHKRGYKEKRAFDFLLNQLKFFLKGMFLVTKTHFRNPYGVIHIHNIPDFLIFMGLIPKLIGSKLILDVHDIVPEFFCQKFDRPLNSNLSRLLLFFEKLSVRFADHVIVANDIWREKIIKRDSVRPEKCTTILNYPLLEFFNSSRKRKENSDFILIYPGTISKLHGLDVAIMAVAIAKRKISNIRLDIYAAGGNMLLKERLISMARNLGLEKNVNILGPLSPESIGKIISEADVGITPKLGGIFSDEAFSTKILEFMAAGIPVVASRTKIDEYYFDDSMIKFFKAGSSDDMARCICELYEKPELREKLSKNGKKYIEKNNWEDKKSIYCDIVSKKMLGSEAKKRGIKICMIAYTAYSPDTRVKSYVKSIELLDGTVDIFVLRENEEKKVEHDGKKRIFHLTKKYQGNNPLFYTLSYVLFFINVLIKVSRYSIKERYTAVHVNNMPNFIIFTAVIPKLLGARLILDVHDLMTAVYLSKFKVRDNHILIKVLLLEQTISAKIASQVLCADDLQKNYLVKVCKIPADKVTVIMNLPNQNLFRTVKTLKQDRSDEKFRLVYHGTISYRLGIDIILSAIQKVKDEIPVLLSIFGTGDFLGEAIKLSEKLGLNEAVYFNKSFFPSEMIPEMLSGMDLGIIGNRRSLATERYMMPVKLMEYIAMKIPVIAPRLEIIQFYCGEDMIKFYEPENVDELAKSVVELYRNPRERDLLRYNSSFFLKKRNWETQAGEYRKVLMGDDNA